jgi:hypothetical protein
LLGIVFSGNILVEFPKHPKYLVTLNLDPGPPDWRVRADVGHPEGVGDRRRPDFDPLQREDDGESSGMQAPGRQGDKGSVLGSFFFANFDLFLAGKFGVSHKVRRQFIVAIIFVHK